MPSRSHSDVWSAPELVGAMAMDSSRARGSGRAEEHHLDLLAADGSDELAGRAVDEDQHDEPELDSPEVWPHHLAPEATGGREKTAHAPPGGDEVLEIGGGGATPPPRVPG